MNDRILNLHDTDELTIVEDEYHNLVLKFEREVYFEKGDKITIVSSLIAEKAKQEERERIYRDISANGHITMEEFKEEYLK